MMAPVPPYGHKVPDAGRRRRSARILWRSSHHLESRPRSCRAKLAPRPRRKCSAASSSRALEALITECVLGASRYNADERVFASLAETFPGVNWKQLADYMVGRVVVHGERRAREMEEVAATLREIDIEPIMAEAIVRRMDWSVEAGLKQLFGGEAPKSYRDVVDAAARKPVGAD